MSNEGRIDEGLAKNKSKRKTKAATQTIDEPIDEKFDEMLESLSKPTNLAALIKSKSARRPTAEAASGWSNDIDVEEDNGDRDIRNVLPPQQPIIRQNARRAAEEITATDIPTIPMDDAEGDDTIDLTPQVAVAPEFSVQQIQSFKEIENEFSRQHTSQYIDSKIDIGILYNNLHLQEQLDAEGQTSWDWDKLFVEVRNSITNPAINS